MKILHVLYSGLGGHGNVFFSMVSADKKKEFEYEALFNGVEDVREEYKERCTKYNIAWDVIKKKPGLDISYYIQLYKKIKTSKADYIFLHGGNAIIPARLAKLFSNSIKIILVRETQANHLKTKADWIRLSLCMMFAGKMVYLSDEYKSEVKNTLKWLFRTKYTLVIPNGIDLDIFNPAAKKDNSSIVLGMQSRLIDIKDHTTLLKAFALLNSKAFNLPLKLYLAGDGACKDELINTAERLGITNNTYFLGMINEKDVVNFLNSLNIYIHASLGETMSTAIMQAMACGKPVVASDVAGINNMIENNVNGLLVPVKNEIKLAAVLEELIINLDEGERLGKAALLFAENNFSNLTMFERYKQAFLS